MPSEVDNCQNTTIAVAGGGKDVLVLDVRGRPAHQGADVKGEVLCSLLVGAGASQ